MGMAFFFLRVPLLMIPVNYNDMVKLTMLCCYRFQFTNIYGNLQCGVGLVSKQKIQVFMIISTILKKHPEPITDPITVSLLSSE